MIVWAQTNAKMLARRRQAFIMRRNRHPCLFVAELKLPDEPSQLVLITNYATRGLTIQALNPPPKGAEVSVEIAYLRTYVGTIRWSKERFFGLRTDEPVDVLELSLTKPGPHFSDYSVPHSPALEGIFLHAAFRQHALDKA